MRITEGHDHQIELFFTQIVLISTIRKCMGTSEEILYFDTEA